MRKPRRLARTKSEINVTPFIDILLVLLVIFMTISPTTPTGFRTDIPQAAPPAPTRPADETIVISLDKSGALEVNRKPVEFGSLSGELADIYKSRHDKTAFLQADPELLFDQVAHVIDLVKGAGIDRLGLMTEQISAR